MESTTRFIIWSTNVPVSCFSLPELLILPQFAVPAFPGATRTCWTCGDWASFQASACSRPPPPTTNTFTTIVPEEMKNVSTLITAFTLLIKHQFNCMCMLTYSKRPVSSCEEALTFIGCRFCNQLRTEPFKQEKKKNLWPLNGKDTRTKQIISPGWALQMFSFVTVLII